MDHLLCTNPHLCCPSVHIEHHLPTASPDAERRIPPEPGRPQYPGDERRQWEKVWSQPAALPPDCYL